MDNEQTTANDTPASGDSDCSQSPRRIDWQRRHAKLRARFNGYRAERDHELSLAIGKQSERFKHAGTVEYLLSLCDGSLKMLELLIPIEKSESPKSDQSF